MAREAEWAQISLPSGEIRRIPSACRATVGTTSNGDHSSVVLGKAGRKRWMGRRPHVRGTAMNPIDHPHGGGEGRTSGGRHPVTPWGKGTKGTKTRSRKKSNKMIITSRHKAKRRK
jgi:large subunit ribosomal protein L2